MLELPFYHSQAHWLAFMLLLGGVAGKCWQEKEREHRYTFGIRVGGVLIPAVLVAFMSTHFQTLWQTKNYVETQGNNFQALTKISNPFGIGKTLEFLLMSQQLGAAINIELAMMVSGYLEWAERFSTTEPSPTLYANMILAANHLGNKENSLLIEKRAKKLFPDSKEVASAIKAQE